jgi:DNA-binding response OmpR family regulator
MSVGVIMKVLVIEDSSGLADVICLILNSQWSAAEISHSSLGISGVAQVQDNQPDVVILDIGLPDISGFEVIKRIRRFSRVPIIVLSAICDEEAIAAALEHGANRYITKPFRKSELIMGIEAVMPKEPEPVAS